MAPRAVKLLVLSLATASPATASPGSSSTGLAKAKVNSTAALAALEARRLSFLDMISGAASSLSEEAMSAFSGSAGDFVKEGMKVAATVVGGGSSEAIMTVVKLFEDAETHLAQGVEYAVKAWTTFGSFEEWLQQLFDLFQSYIPVSRRLQAAHVTTQANPQAPQEGYTTLEEVFAEGDIMTLLTSKSLIHQLIVLVEHVLESSKFLNVLSSAVRLVMEIFGELHSVFDEALSALSGIARRRLREEGGEERRLSGLDSYMDLLQGIDFDTITTTLGGFMSKVTGFALTLDQINATLGPLLYKLEAQTARRLQAGGEAHTESFSEMQHHYSDAFKKVVPTWQAVEETGLQLCPHVLDSQSLAHSLQCRVQGFISGSGILANLVGLVGPGGSCEVNQVARRLKDFLPIARYPMVAASLTVLGRRLQAPAQDVDQCPTVSHAAGVNDFLGANADMLGAGAAVAASFCFLPLGVVVRRRRKAKELAEKGEPLPLVDEEDVSVTGLLEEDDIME